MRLMIGHPMTTIARKAFRVLGTTNDVTECELCGRAELKGTIVLVELDADGNDGGVVYYGASCGAKAAGWTTKDVRKAAKDADTAVREAFNAWRDAESHYFCTMRDVHFGGWVKPTLVMEWSRTPEVVAAMTAWMVENPCPVRS